jgi:hypothetical protein
MTRALPVVFTVSMAETSITTEAAQPLHELCKTQRRMYIYGLSDEGACERWVYDLYFRSMI